MGPEPALGGGEDAYRLNATVPEQVVDRGEIVPAPAGYPPPKRWIVAFRRELLLDGGGANCGKPRPEWLAVSRVTVASAVTARSLEAVKCFKALDGNPRTVLAQRELAASLPNCANLTASTRTRCGPAGVV